MGVWPPGLQSFTGSASPPMMGGCSPGPDLGRPNQVLAASLCTRGKSEPHTPLFQTALRFPNQTNLSDILIRSLCSASLSGLSIMLHCPTLRPCITTYSTTCAIMLCVTPLYRAPLRPLPRKDHIRCGPLRKRKTRRLVPQPKPEINGPDPRSTKSFIIN